MTQMQVQPLHSREHALTMARINEHHSLYGNVINSDTVLWLSWYVSLWPGSIRSMAADSIPLQDVDAWPCPMDQSHRLA